MMKLAAFATSRAHHSLAWAAVAMILIMAVGTLGYRLMGGPQYTLMDCFYMTFITVATIGFGEVVDVSQITGGRLFTVAIATFGIGTMTYMLSTFTAFILESDINEARRRRKMQSKIDKLQDHYIVCGIGRVGSNVAQELALTGRHNVIVDADMGQIENYLERNPGQLYLHGDATDNDVLLAAGVQRARGVFSVATDDSQNLVISLSAKQLNPKLRVVARCHDVKNVEKTRRAGADEIVSPDFTGGLRIVSAMLRPHVVSFLDEMIKSEDNLRMEEIVVPDGFSGQSLSSLSSVTRDYVVLAIRHGGKWVFNPPMQHLALGGDILMVMTTPHGRTRLEQLIPGVS
jgi:voltage-gated potassium channel